MKIFLPQGPVKEEPTTVDDLVTDVPQELAQRFAQLEDAIAVALKGGADAVLNIEQLGVIRKALEYAELFFNNIPQLRCYGNALEALENRTLPKAERARLAVARLQGFSDQEDRSSTDAGPGRPRDPATDQLIWSYRYLIGEVEAQTETEWWKAWALRTNASSECGAFPLQPADAIAFLRRCLPGSQSEGAIAKKLSRAGLRNIPGSFY